MKKYDFLPSTAQLRAKKQDFCKNAQWRAKKLRERGSSTARPTEKGIGGSPDSVDSVDFGASISVDFGRAACVGRVLSRFGVPVVSVASCRSCRFGRDLACFVCRSCRSCGRDLACRSSRSQGANTKKSPIPQSGDRAQLSQGVARS